jgi:putative addiction module component (TIGR02574 family)
MATKQDVLKDALHLSPDQRAELVADLLNSLEPAVPTQDRSEAEWLREVQRRARAAMAGTPGLSWDEALRLVHSRLA